MLKRIIFFNIIYYAVIIGLIKLGGNDPGSSLGYGYFIAIFWIIAAVVLIILLRKKIIHPASLVEKLGVFMATPVLSIIVITIIVTSGEKLHSEWYFNKDNYRYKVKTFDIDRSTGGKRIEYYRSSDTVGADGVGINDTWVKDSTWIYLSKAGDTIKKVKYKNDLEVQ